MDKNILQIWEDYHFMEIVKELKSENISISYENIPRIVEAMSFNKRSRRNSEKCPYYKEEPLHSCHNMNNLNCLLCACPNYNSKELEGGCVINSKKGKWTYHENLPAGRVWDCSDCKINHSKEEVEYYLKKNIEKLIKLYISI
jgi:Zn-finger protein